MIELVAKNYGISAATENATLEFINEDVDFWEWVNFQYRTKTDIQEKETLDEFQKRMIDLWRAGFNESKAND